ncbi:hypothetical protein ATY41_02930 [Leifsonia xyli subsp. xyli]|uniref:Signal peptidase I n=2 Tax=Leifsonia xyli subsp. xyli TaxID=59736 RepID=Q6AC81_LEIXX|nr:S26 family signal peptidase [Leifsonia xyli]AAT90012.1 signal peptidase I [Leifsonia xyli subsp. xyli str. CTCB07]ODA90010.1 hypothetical protein ATY41_02930 [Leifsonia xyli subsp. xyli]
MTFEAFDIDAHRRDRWKLVRDIALVVVIGVLAATLVKSYLVRSFSIPSASMEATLQKGERVLVNELIPGAVPLQRGDIVVFQDPGGWLQQSGPDTRPWPVQDARWVGEQLGVVPARRHRLVLLRGRSPACQR